MNKLNIDMMNAQNELNKVKSEFQELIVDVQQNVRNPDQINQIFEKAQLSSMKGSNVHDDPDSRMLLGDEIAKHVEENDIQYPNFIFELYLSDFFNQSNGCFNIHMDFEYNLYKLLTSNNKLNFKASSIFSKAMLFENDFVHIQTEFNILAESRGENVELVLKIYPKVQHLICDFHFFENSDFIEKEMDFHFKSFDQPIVTKIIKNYADSFYNNLPLLAIKSNHLGTVVTHKLWVPMTINKYFDFMNLDQTLIFNLIEKVS